MSELHIPLIAELRGFQPGEHRIEGLRDSIVLSLEACERIAKAPKGAWGVFGQLDSETAGCLSLLRIEA